MKNMTQKETEQEKKKIGIELQVLEFFYKNFLSIESKK